MLAGIARSAAIAAAAVPLVALAASSASAAQPDTPTSAARDRPATSTVDSPYIWVNICVHIPTPGSATLNWCWP